MTASALPREERVGLLAAVMVHGALLAILVFRPVSGDVVRPPERITVTLSDEVGLVSTSPDPFSDVAPDVAPTIGEAPADEATEAELAPALAPPRRPNIRERRRPDRP